MKNWTSKLLALLMALTVIGALAVTAMAEGETGGETEGETGSETPECTHAEKEYTYTSDDQHKVTCKAEGCDYEETEACSYGDTYSSKTNTTHSQTCTKCKHVKTSDHTFEDKSNATHHWKECTACEKVVSKTTHKWTIDKDHTEETDEVHISVCSGCSETKETAHTCRWTKKADGHSGKCTTCDRQISNAPHDFDETGKCTLCSYANTAAAASGELLNVLDISLGSGDTEQLEFIIKDEDGNATTNRTKVKFTSDKTSVAAVSPTGLVTARSAGTATITLSVDGVDCGSVDVIVHKAKNISFTISDTESTYYFTNSNNSIGSSISEQLRSAIKVQSGSTYSDYTVVFNEDISEAASLNSRNDTDTLANLSRVYLSIYDTGTWTAEYIVSLGFEEILRGKITVKVEPYTGIDILYTASAGQSVALKVTDFQSFWSKQIDKGGKLEYVHINSVTGVDGTLCYNHKSNESYHDDAEGSYYYVSPSSALEDKLSDLTFVPYKSGSSYSTGSVTISFTAYGTDRNSADESFTGSVVICYTNGQVKDITLNATGSLTALSISDFNTVYKAATGSTVSKPSFDIKFLEVPTYGTLYYGYSANSYNNATALTKNNVDTYTFSNQTDDTYAIDEVCYVPGNYSAAADSVRYGVYDGNELLYVGNIVFSAKKVTITYGCYANGVTFSSGDFYYGSDALVNVPYVSFGTPSSGTLYVNYSNGKGTVVTGTDLFAYNASSGVYSLNSVSFIPKANFTGIVEIPLYATSGYTSYLAGTVKIYVVAKPFADVPNNWSTPYINRLYASGVVSGTTATTFSPKNTMKYGEALKMILLAAGYPKQAELTGTNWAANYLKLAYNQGIVSSTNIDLNIAITRDAMAELVAKALNISKATSVNAGITAPTDSTNGYVLALYNAGIVSGDSSSGKNCYYGSRSINRDEVAKIICNIMDYEK